LGLEFVTRVVRTSAVVAPLVALFLATYVSPASGASFALGALWGSLNLLTVSSFVRTLFGKENPSKLRVAGIVLLKFPVLYASGLLLLMVGIFPLGSLVSGFSLILAVILLKAFGALVAEKLRERGRRIYA
jgi:hypothetical protein